MEKDMIKVAVVGAGFMGSLHASCVANNPRAKRVAVVDVNANAGTALAERYGAQYFPSVSDVLNAQVDAFIVALPDRLHVAAAVEILQAGGPVLVEKPLADTLEGARAIASAARATSSRIMAGHILRFDPRYAAAAESVRRGDIGDIVHVTAGRFGTRNIGMKLKGSSSVCFYIGVHDVDAIQWITGTRIERVYSRSVSKIMPLQGVDSEDAILSTLDLTGGAIGSLFNGWSRPDSGPFVIDGRFELMGTKGTLEIDVRDHGLRILGPDGYRIPDGLHWPEVNGHIVGDLAAEVDHFLSCIASDAPFTQSIEEAMGAVAVNDAILRSVVSGNPEAVEII